MASENSDGDELPTGASVFDDVELPAGASVFDNDDLPAGNSVFATDDTSVFAPQESPAAPSEVFEASTSVFGNSETPSTADNSPLLESTPLVDESPTLVADVSPVEEAPPVVMVDGEPHLDLRDAPVADEMMSSGNDDHPGFDDLIDDGSEDAVAMPDGPGLSIPDEPSSDSVFATDFAAEPIAEHMPAHGFDTPLDDEITTGEPIALDVDPNDDEGLEQWSDLGTAAPSWSDASDADEAVVGAEHAAPVDAASEREVVAVGAADSTQFFEFDDSVGGGPVYADAEPEPTGSAGSDLQSRVLTGAVLLGLAVVAFSFSSTLALIAIVIVVAIASGEFFNALRIAGYQPATLLGLAASVAMPLAVFVRGTQAVAMILGLTVVFGLLWYLAGVASEMPVMNLGVTVLGVAYIGGLASFGAAIIENSQRAGLTEDDRGTQLLLIALILTISYDIGAYFSGRSMGRTPLTAVSPNKTVEGLIGGMVLTVVSSVVFITLLGSFFAPISDNVSTIEAIVLGIVVAIMAPLGDLAESLIKRDLHIKDMGAILPGHGGVLDRVDALLFVLPTVYFFALAFIYA